MNPLGSPDILLRTGLLLVAMTFFPRLLLAEEPSAMPSRENSTADQVTFYLAVGDRYQKSEQWEKALQNYEQALALAPFDVRLHRRIVGLYFPWWEDYTHGSSHDSGPIWSLREKAVDSLYKINALDPEAKKDKEIIEWEYQFFVKQFGGPFTRNTKPKKAEVQVAEEILVRKNALEPQNPEVLSTLGLTRANLAKYFGGQDNGLEYIKKAIRLDPKNPEYRETLAETFAMHNLRAEAIQEYIAAIQLIEGEDHTVNSKKISVATRCIEVFADAARIGTEQKFEVWPKFSSIAMSREKKIETLQYVIDLVPIKTFYYWRQSDGPLTGEHILPLIWLGGLLFDAEDYQSADQMFFRQKEADPYAMDEEVYERWIETLKKGGHNPERLVEVRQEYEEKYGEANNAPATKSRH